MICSILNFAYKFIGRLQEQTRKQVRMSLYFLIFFFALLYGSVLSNVHLLVKCIIGTVFMAGAIIFSMTGSVKRPKWDPVLTILWLAVGLLQLISSIFVSLEYLPMTCIWLVGFPALFIVWTNRRDYKILFGEVAAAANWSFLVMVVVSVVFAPVRNKAYGAIFHNENAVGQWITFAFPFVAFLSFQAKSKSKKILYWVESTLIYVLCILSRGRTALLAILGMTIIFLVFWLVSRPGSFSLVGKKAVAFLLVAIVSASVFMGANRLSAAINLSLPYIDELEDDELISPEEMESGPSALQLLWDRILGVDKGSQSVNDYSSGRVGIWIAALEKTNLLGHPSRDHIITKRNGDVGNNAHNTVIQFIYNNGLIAGIIYALMMLYSGIKMLIRAIRNRSLQRTEIYLLMIHCGFWCTAMLASIDLPFLYLITFAYYLSYAPLLDRGETAAGR